MQILSTHAHEGVDFEAFYDAYQSLVIHIITKYVSNRAIAEELAQDVFLKAWQAFARLRPNSNHGAWVGTIASRTALDYLRRPNRPCYSLEEQEQYLLPADTSQDPQQVFGGPRELIAVAIQTMPESYGRVLQLHYIEKSSVDEIARLTKKSLGATRTALARARQMFRARYLALLELEEENVAEPVALLPRKR